MSSEGGEKRVRRRSLHRKLYSCCLGLNALRLCDCNWKDCVVARVALRCCLAVSCVSCAASALLSRAALALAERRARRQPTLWRKAARVRKEARVAGRRAGRRESGREGAGQCREVGSVAGRPLTTRQLGSERCLSSVVKAPVRSSLTH